MTLAINNHFTTWKTHFLPFGDGIILTNSVISSLPTYWMYVFALPKWVRREIDKVRHDFLWSGCDISKPKCQGGWGILNLTDFNFALLGKRWWKFCNDNNPFWGDILPFNYMSSVSLFTLLHSTQTKKNPTFGKVYLSVEQPSLLALRCLSRMGVLLPSC